MLSDVDECAEKNGGCHDQRKCTNTEGGRTCGDCPSGLINAGDTDCTGLYLSVDRLCWILSLHGVYVELLAHIILEFAAKLVHAPRVSRRERVRARQWRVRQQARVREHGGRPLMQGLSCWLGQRWRQGLQRSVPATLIFEASTPSTPAKATQVVFSDGFSLALTFNTLV